MEKMKKHFLRRMALVMALLTLGSAVLVGCGEQKEPEPDPKDEVIVEPEPIQLPDGVSFDEKKYPDVFGFIQIPNATQCAISKGHYLAQSPKSTKSSTGYDDDYYLQRDLDGKTNKAGSLYIQAYYNKSDLSDPMTVIYGHNMADGSMFHSLMSYTEKSAWDYNSLIFFDTLKERHIYKIFAVFKTSANAGKGFSYHQFVDAQNETEFNDFVTNCKNLSFYDTGITPKYGDKIICLSTCEYTLNNGRLVVAAVRIS
mgnify:CR=1 FL=1